MNEEEIKKLTEVLGLRKKEENVTTDAVGSWLSQISIALLIVFIIAYVLFAGGAQTAIDLAKEQADHWFEEYTDINDTSVGKEREKHANALIDLQKARLEVALEKVEFQERSDFGIVTFAPRDVNGTINYRMSEILSGSKVISELFKESCVRSSKALSNQQLMRQKWYPRILLVAEVQNNDSPLEKSIVKHPELLSKKNAEWLLGEIRVRISGIYADCRDMQGMVLSYLSNHYSENPDALESIELTKQLETALSAPDEEKQRLISNFSDEMHRQIKSLFKEQGVPLLDGV